MQFESINCILKSGSSVTNIVNVYRPPPSAVNGLSSSQFFLEWSSFLERLTLSSKEVIIVGDFNFHLDIPGNGDAVKFLDQLQQHGFKQHINEATHVGGHTLDVFITYDSCSLLHDAPSTFDPGLADCRGNTL